MCHRVQDALWSVINMSEALLYPCTGGSSSGTISSSSGAPAPAQPSAVSLVRALGPLLHVYQLPGAEHLGHMLALVIR